MWETDMGFAFAVKHGRNIKANPGTCPDRKKSVNTLFVLAASTLLY